MAPSGRSRGIARVVRSEFDIVYDGDQDVHPAATNIVDRPATHLFLPCANSKVFASACLCLRVIHLQNLTSVRDCFGASRRKTSREMSKAVGKPHATGTQAVGAWL